MPCTCIVFGFYDFCRVHKALGVTLGVNPATAAGVANVVMKMSDADALIDAEAAKVPAARGPYKQREAENSTKTLSELHSESTAFSTGLSQNHQPVFHSLSPDLSTGPCSHLSNAR